MGDSIDWGVAIHGKQRRIIRAKDLEHAKEIKEAMDDLDYDSSIVGRTITYGPYGEFTHDNQIEAEVGPVDA